MNSPTAFALLWLTACAPRADEFFVLLPQAQEVHVVEQGQNRYLSYSLTQTTAPLQVTNSITEALTKQGWRPRYVDRLGNCFPLNASRTWSCQSTGKDSEQCFWGGEWERPFKDTVHYGVLVSRHSPTSGRIELTAMLRQSPDNTREFALNTIGRLSPYLAAIFGACLAYLIWLHHALLTALAQRHSFEWRKLGLPYFWANMSPGLFSTFVRYAWNAGYERLRDEKISETGYLLQVFYRIAALLAAFWIVSLGF